MITYQDGVAAVAFPWPTNDTGGRILKEMSQAALSALTAAGYTVTTRPAFHAVERAAEGTGYVFTFTAPAIAPEPIQERGA